MCLTPVTLTRRLGSHVYQVQVPCNKCLECVKDKQNEYVVRSLEEQRKRGSMVFFTLTYSPEALPMTDEFEIDEDTGECLKNGETQTLYRKDLRDWKRAFERYYSRKGQPLDYGFVIKGEYGPRTQRPHYHGLLFGLSKEVVDEIMSRWSKKYGFVVYKFIPSTGADGEKVAKYCSKYMCKDENWNHLPSPFAEKPRIQTSQFFGMPSPRRWKKEFEDYYLCRDIISTLDKNDPKFASGKQWWFVLNEIIRRRYYTTTNGNTYKLPKYYIRKLFYNDERRESIDPASGKKVVERKVVRSPLQAMVSFALQCKFNTDNDRKLQSLAAERFDGDLAKAIMFNQASQEDDKSRRAIAYAENNQKYMVKSVC